MHKKFRKHLLAIGILVVTSLLPFWWLRGGYVIAGHDAGLPLSPKEHFLDRLSVWTYRYQSGSDQTFALAGFFLHGLEFVLDLTPFSLSTQQSLQFSLYFLLFGLSAYWASCLLFPKQNQWFHALAGVMYQFNHFILQAWFIAERTKFTIYIALPMVIALIINTSLGKIQPLKAGLYVALLLWVFNGGGFLPLYGSLFITSLSVMLGMLLGYSQKKTTAKKLAIAVLAASTSLVGLNAYWLLPYIGYLRQSYSQVVSQAGGITGVLNWITSISAETSFTNIFRLQGIQEWYVNGEHPYAAEYFSNPVLILASFIPIIIFALALHKASTQKNKKILVLLGMGLISTFLMAGSHAPFGHIYVLMIKLIPGFIAFRTPFYKFAPGFIASLALTLPWALASLTRKSTAVACAAILGVIAYNYPFYASNFFQYTHDRSTKVQIPEYVFDYQAYIDTQNLNKTLLYPGLDPNDYSSKYEWGYWSLAPLQSLVDRHQYVTPMAGGGLIQTVTNELYENIRDNKEYWPDVAGRLGIDSILIQRDFSEFTYQGKSSSKVINALATNSRLQLIRSFGKWDLYSLDHHDISQTNYIQVSNPDSFIGFNDFINANTNYSWQFFTTDQQIEGPNLLGRVIQAECQDCQLKREQFYLANADIIFTPSSPFYSITSSLDNETNSPIAPISSLRTLYIIQTMINRKESGEYRLPVWDQYVDALQKFQLQVEEDVKNLPNSNKVLSYKLANLQYQKNTLKTLSVFINSAEESQKFIQSVLVANKIETIITENISITTEPNQYIYTVESKKPGSYQAYVYSEDLNAPINGSDVQVASENDQYKLNTASASSWFNIGLLELNQGVNKVTLKDSSFPYDSPSPRQISIGGTNSCETILSESLPAGLYTFRYDSKPIESDLTIWSHISDNIQSGPLLPFWGFESVLRQNTSKTHTVLHEIRFPTKIDLIVCAHTLNNPATIEVSNITIDRQTSPNLVMFMPVSNPITNESDISFTRVNNTNNVYEFEDQSYAVINTLRPYTFGWTPTPQDTKYLKINDGSTGILKTPDHTSPIKESYGPQKTYLIGWIITLASSMLIVTILIKKHE